MQYSYIEKVVKMPKSIQKQIVYGCSCFYYIYRKIIIKCQFRKINLNLSCLWIALLRALCMYVVKQMFNIFNMYIEKL